MATKLEQMNWERFKKRYSALFDYGVKEGLIYPYETELIENLRQVYYGGVPASIILLSHRLCNRRCYDRALLVTFGFGDDDFQLVEAGIDRMRLKPTNIDDAQRRQDSNFANHCFAERRKKDGSIWVYDTTSGLVFEKSLYYMMENPQITRINDKQATLNCSDYQDIKNADINKDKYALPYILPAIEAMTNEGNELYYGPLKEEIARFKQVIGYDAIYEEVDEVMRAKGFR